MNHKWGPGPIKLLPFLSWIWVLVFLQSPASAIPADFALLDNYLQAQFVRAGIPGAALVVVSKEKIVHSRNFGISGPDGRAVTQRTRFLIGSSGKSMTALAIMQLVEAGKIDLDAPVKRYIPFFRTNDARASDQMTVRNLLNQSSGFTNLDGQDYFFLTDTATDVLEKQVRKLSTLGLASVPGLQFNYSNINYIVLGALIESVSGEPYHQYIKRHLFDPLQMNGSAAAGAVPLGADVATGYRYWFGNPISAPGLPEPKVLVPTGWIFSTAEDMGRYLITHVNGGAADSARILSAKGIDELHRKDIQIGPGQGYAMGWYTDAAAPDTFYHEGSAPSFASAMAVSPKGGWGYALLFNSDYAISDSDNLFLSKQIRRFFEGKELTPIVLKKTLPLELAGLVLLIATGFVCPVYTARKLRNWRGGTAVAAGRPLFWIVHFSLPAANALIVAYMVLIAVPDWTGSRISSLLLFAPDAAWIMIIGVAAVATSALAAQWYVIRVYRWSIRAADAPLRSAR